MPRSQISKNKDEGAIFETLFKNQGQRNGLLILKNHLTAKYTYGGRIQLVKSELDYRVIRPSDGRVGFFDCKSYQEDRFNYSVIEEKQIERSLLYNQNRVPSGFVVWFRRVNKIVLITGHEIALKGPRSSFGVEDGLLLGSFSNFDLKKLLA